MEPVTVRVHLASWSPAGCAIRCEGELEWSDPTGTRIDATPPGTAVNLAACDEVRAVWQEADHSILAAGSVLRVRGSEGQPLRVEAGGRTRLYPGSLEIRAAGPRLKFTSEAPLEEYVRGVMAAETPAQFHPEAIKAMAVAVRSYALASCRKHGAEGDLCDGTHCQIFRGIARVPAAIDAAVDATTGLVALYEGRPIEALYSADCGGWTENSENAWKGAGALAYLRAVEDAPAPGRPPYCTVNRSHDWRVLIPAKQLHAVAGRPELKPGERLLLELVTATGSGHARVLGLFRETPAARVAAAEGEPGEVPEASVAPDGTPLAAPMPPVRTLVRRLTVSELLRATGSGPLRSMRFGARPTEDGGALLEGSGWGHGVGLCQYGAEGMARSEAQPDFQAILRHYYRGITIGPLVKEARVARRAER